MKPRLNEIGSESREIAFESLLAAAVAVVFWLVAKRMGLFQGLLAGRDILENGDLQELLLVFLSLGVGLAVATFYRWKGFRLGLASRRVGEAALAKSLEQYATLVQTIPDIIYELDPDGKFTFLSDAIRHLGYTPGELLGASRRSRNRQPRACPCKVQRKGHGRCRCPETF